MTTGKRTGDWIQTFSGIAFWPLDPRPEEVRIQDIAHALALQCRFLGHTRVFYSVAEHSVRVSDGCDYSDALWGLLHDASEAYLADVSKPVKQLDCLAPYRDAEERVMRVVAERFGLTWQEPESVKAADRRMLAIEAHSLLASMPDGWWPPRTEACRDVILEPWSPEQAEKRFLERFYELTGREGSAHVRRLARIAELEDIVQGVGRSGVAVEDPSLSYVEVKIDRRLWEKIQAEAR